MGITDKTRKPGSAAAVKMRNISGALKTNAKAPKSRLISGGAEKETILIEKVELEDLELFNKFSSPSANIKDIIANEFEVDISVRGNVLLVKGNSGNVAVCAGFIRDLINIYKNGKVVTDNDLIRLAKLKIENPGSDIGTQIYPAILTTPRKKVITPRTANQKKIYRRYLPKRYSYRRRTGWNRQDLSCYGMRDIFISKKAVRQNNINPSCG